MLPPDTHCASSEDASLDDPRLDELVERFVTRGWAVQPDFAPPAVWRDLARAATARFEDGEFRRGGVGRGATLRLRPEVRSDHVRWLEPDSATAAERAYLESIERLRLAINQRLFLGLWRFESHYAVFPAGAFYRRHLDQFRGTAHRTVTCVLYLNDGWTADDGGCLRIYTTNTGKADDAPSEPVTAAALVDGVVEPPTPPEREHREATPADEPHDDVLPLGGTLVAFLSDRFEHEVLPGARDRVSLTGWLCRRDD